MTGAEIITKFENMVEDTLDTDFAYQLLNDAKDEIESLQIWEYLKVQDSSATETTAAISLPTSFALPIQLTVGDDYEPYTLVPMEKQREYRTNPRSYYIDFRNDQYYLNGTPSTSRTIYFTHTVTSADITSGSSWGFPNRFHSILPLKMAQLYYAVDAGEKQRAWDDRWTIYYNQKLGQMQTWDAQLKMRGNLGRVVSSRGENPKAIENY